MLLSVLRPLLFDEMQRAKSLVVTVVAAATAAAAQVICVWCQGRVTFTAWYPHPHCTNKYA